MSRLIVVMVVVIVMTIMSGMFVATASASMLWDGPPILDGWTWIPGVGSFDAYASSGGGNVSAWVSVSLDNTNGFSVGRWEFWVDPQDTSRWTANFYSHGFLGVPQPSFDPWVQDLHINRVGVALSHRISEFFASGEDGISRPNMSASLTLSPAKLDSSEISYGEDVVVWSSDDSLRNIWYVEYRLEGEFVASTLGEAQAMGAQFTPEPATICLLGLGASALLPRRRR